MQSKTIVLLFIFAGVLILSEFACAGKVQIGHHCQRDSNCRSKCCVKHKCADSPKWCPCSISNNPCDKQEQVCTPQEVQCIKAPCYPIANCQPRFPPVTPKSE